MKTLFFDIETDGLDPSVIHCLVINDGEKEIPYVGKEIPKGIELLANNLIVGHNCIGYDLPVLKKLFSYTHENGLVHDTLCLSRLIYPDITNSVDVKLLARGLINRNSVGKHSLKSWGERLQFKKLDYAQNNPKAFEKFNDQMLEYCIQDVRLTKKLYEKFMAKGFSKESIELEHKIAFITKQQELRGFYFDEKKAQSLQAKLLSRYNTLKLDLEKAFLDWEEDLGEFVPKVNNSKLGYKKGVPFRKTKLVKFNPSSRHHIANRLIKLRNWKPKEFTATGQPMIDEEVLSNLDYPEAKLLNEYLLIEKRLGMLSEGTHGYLKVCKKGKIHTSYVTNIVTGRMSSRYPNLQNIPNMHSLYGKEFRELFIPKEGYKLVGVDATSLEAVCFAHYIYNYEGGKKYADLILNGDFHTYNMKAAGLQSRELSKTMFYALLYGSSFKRLSEILNCSLTDAKNILEKFYRQLPFLKQIKTDIIEKIEAHGNLRAIDKRILTIRSNHATLNSLIQSCGAIIMKKALTILWDNLKDKDAWIVATIHDEFQIEAREPEVEFVGKLAVDSIKKAGEHFNLRVPVGANYRVGKNWSETH